MTVQESTHDSHATPLAFAVLDALQPVRRRLGLARVRSWTVRGVGAGAVPALLLVGLSHVTTLPAGTVVAVDGAVLLLGALAGAAVGVWQWPDAGAAARAADHHFALQDRLITALEYRASSATFPGLQRDETRRRVAGLPLARSGALPLDRWETALAGVLVAALVAALVVGGASHGGTSSAGTAEQRQLHRVTASRVHQITRQVGSGLSPAVRNNPTLRKLQLALERLRRRLENTATRAAALRAISATQARLQHLTATLHPISRSAVAQLNSALSGAMTARQRAAATAGDRQALTAAAQTLQRLAAKLNHMNAAQRAQLARQLAQAANATNDGGLQSQLRQAASSLGYNDPQSAAQALQSAASALAQTPAQRAAQARLAAAGSRLDQLKNAVSGLQPGTGERTASGSAGRGATSAGGGNGRARSTGAGHGKGSAGAGSGQGSGSSGKSGAGKGAGAGTGAGKGSGKDAGAGAGTGTGTGTGQGSGSAGSSPNAGSGSGSGQGAPGAHGAGGGRGGAGPKGQGKYATVYVPYRQGKGPNVSESGPNGAPQSGPIVPYQQVVGTYGQTAHQALDRANLPPELRSYVRKYFSTVSH